MPSSCRRTSAAASSASRIRSPALSWATRSAMASHSGVAYSGWEPTSRYNRAPFSRNTFEDRPQCTTRRNRYRATSSGERRRWPRNVQVTPYSFSSPKMRRSTGMSVGPPQVLACQDGGEFLVGEPAELPPPPGPVQHGGLEVLRGGGPLLHLGQGRGGQSDSLLQGHALPVGV